MRLIAIYDNSGATVDRFTVITDIVDHSGQYHDALGLSDAPDSHMGYSQWATVLRDDSRYSVHNRQWRTRCDLGKRVQFESLNDELQAHIASRLWVE